MSRRLTLNNTWRKTSRHVRAGWVPLWSPLALARYTCLGNFCFGRLSTLPLFWQYRPFPFVKSSTAGLATPRIDSKQPTEEVRNAMTGGPVVHRGETVGAPEGCHENTLWYTDGREYLMWRTIRTQLSNTLGSAWQVASLCVLDDLARSAVEPTLFIQVHEKKTPGRTHAPSPIEPM